MASERAGPHELAPGTVVLALACVVVLSVLTPYIEIILSGTQIGSVAPPAGALLVLFALAGVLDPVLRLVRRKKPELLRQRDLLAVYIALLSAAALSSCQFSGWLATVTTGPYYYANAANHWESYWRFIPSWWGPRPPADADAIRVFYEGALPGAGIPWRPWLRPLFAFGPMVLTLYAAFLALSAILGRQWIDREKLAFPLVQLPLELTARPEGDGRIWSGFFHSRAMWLGAAVPMACHTLNGLNRYFPSVPTIPLRAVDLGRALQNKPWVAAQPVRIDIYFCLIGFAFLCGRDAPVSIWVFYLVSKVEAVLGCAVGWNAGTPNWGLRSTDFPVVVAQQVGSTLTFFGLMTWTARGHLREAWRAARAQVASDTTYRMAFLTLGLALLVLCLWSVGGGMQTWVALVFWLLTLAFMLVVHRFMAEGGVNLLWDAQSGPNYLLYALDGGRYLGPRAWMQLVSLPYFVWHFKGAVGPHSLEGLKLASASSLDRRQCLGLMAGSMVLAAVVGYSATLWLVVRHGGGVALDSYRFDHVGRRPMEEFLAVTGQPEGVRWQKLVAMAAAAGVTWGLSWMRWQFGWWRIHPIGYVLSGVFVIWYLWFSVLVGSALNWLTYRYAGVQAYRRARPFFLGLVFGDFLMLGVWTIVAAATGMRGFQLFAT